MKSEFVIRCDELSKAYAIYGQPHHRLLQMFYRGRRQFYREFWALRGVSFTVDRGETVGIIGKNGSGKSTLLQLICGTLNPTSGSLVTHGRIAALLELGAGFNHEFTGLENVHLNARLLGLSQQELEARIDAILGFADIGEFIHQPIKTYSSGMLVRLAFAVMAHVDADLLIVDEALAVGDAAFNRRCMRFIRQFKQDHSLLFVSHDMSSVTQLCDRAVWLDKGEIRKIGKTKAVCDAYLNTILFAENEKLSTTSDAKLRGEERVTRVSQDNVIYRDQRQDFINASNLRNDLEVYDFKPAGANDAGGEEARVVRVSLVDAEGLPLKWMVGGERVTLTVEVEALKAIAHVVVGFYVRDKLGQNVFGDNTFLSFQNNPVKMAAKDCLKAEFEFVMPWLVRGDYSIVAAIAERDGGTDRLLHWRHDALAFQSHVSPLPTGLVGIPMLDIRLAKST